MTGLKIIKQMPKPILGDLFPIDTSRKMGELRRRITIIQGDTAEAQIEADQKVLDDTIGKLVKDTVGLLNALKEV